METTLDQNPVQYTDVDALKKRNREITDSIKNSAKDLRQQRRINRANIADAKDANIVSNSAEKQGIDINTPYSYPVTDEYGKKLVDTLANHVTPEDKPKLSTFISSIPNPNYIEPPKIDIEREKKQARLQRAAKWADALAIFGAGMNGRSIDDKDLAFNKMQAKRDKTFQDFKVISESNKKTAKDWEVNSRKEALDWIDKQLASDVLSEAERKKYQLAYDQLAQQQAQHNDELGLRNKQLGLQGRELGLKQKELEERIGSDNVSYQSASGQTINRVIPKAEQKDIISRAKTNPEFKKYIQSAMNIKYQNIINADNEIISIPVNELGKEVTDQDLLQAYLRWQTQGAPNTSYPNTENPGQKVEYEPWQFNPNTGAGQPENSQNKPLDDFFK